MALVASLAEACMPPEWGANALLHPARHRVVGSADLPYEDIAFRSDGLLFKGWLFRATGPRRALIVYLHGVGDNRRSGLAIARHFVPMGYHVLAYDSRAHGESEGDNCTYGFYEKVDLSRALDALNSDRAIVFGASLGAAVALQAAAEEPRIRGVIAQSSFSDIETVAGERAPWIARKADLQEAFAIAERRARFRIADVSPLKAAARIRVPVLLLHGLRDRETPPAHSQRIYEALAGPKRLILVPDTGHNDVLGGSGVWKEIDAWIEALPDVATSPTAVRPPDPGTSRSSTAVDGRLVLERVPMASEG